MVVHWQDNPPPETEERAIEPLPLSPFAENLRRGLAVAILGLVLLAGFFLPMRRIVTDAGTSGAARCEYVNLKVVRSDGTPLLARFEFLLPGFAGVMLLVMALLVKGRMRGLVMIALFLTAVATPALNAGLRKSTAELLADSETKRLLLIASLGALSAVGLFATSRARRYRPGMGSAYLVGLIGVAALAGMVMIPVSGGWVDRMTHAISLQQKEDDGIRNLAPREEDPHYGRFFRIVGDPKAKDPGTKPFILVVGDAATGREAPPARRLGRATLFGLTCMAFAALLCLANVPGRHSSTRRRFAVVAFYALLIGVVAQLGVVWHMGYGTLLDGVADLPAKTVSLLRWSFALNSLKLLCWIGGLSLLLPMGITDVLLGRPPLPPLEPEPETELSSPPDNASQTWFGGP